jgi:hypothetical protein
MLQKFFISCFLLVFSAIDCLGQTTPLFTSLPSSRTGISFQNKLVESAGQNIITYEYFYNGGGVGAGDFNNDGLIDLYFTSNQQPNKLYLNKGNWQFEDITKKAGVAGRPGWKTGVSVADVNGDGFLDIYVCYSGDLEEPYRANQLFINNGNLTFTDKAKQMGVADEGYTTHAAFLDYDRDNDLDLFVLNHNIKNLRNFDAAFVKKMIDPGAGDRLYENKNGIFSDVTVKSGIISNPLGYGLGISISDVNNDGWPDMYVCNDYVEEDYLYINNRNGTFTETLKTSLGHLSNFSMGVDIADINNDGFQDIFTLDMLPEDNMRQKLIYAPDNYELYNNTVENGFYHQLMRNMLQLNNGNGTFSEIGQYAGISNTDWSWAALLADYNNDGLKDLFVTNGYGRDMINRDFMKFYANERLKHLQGKTDDRMFLMLQGIQSTPLHNYIFENKNGLQFTDRSADWGFGELNFSHGAVYADLDNDGDLDIVVNKMNQEAGLYKNNTVENKKGGHYLQLSLKTATANTWAIGAMITLYTKSGNYIIENSPVHGFQSSMQGPLHFSFREPEVDSLHIRWPDGSSEIVSKNIPVDQRLTITQTGNKSPALNAVAPSVKTVFTPASLLSYKHNEDTVNDFKIQPLMLNMLSYSGPRMAKADINNDGLEDIFICGPHNQPGKVFMQKTNGEFVPTPQPAVEADAAAEDCGAAFFDADSDGDMDLYVVSGGYTMDKTSALLQDRLYINEKGNLTPKKEALPFETASGSVVVPLDADNDGDTDLFIGGRTVPGNFPQTPQSFLLVNDGKGNFTNKTATMAPVLATVGMVTDAVWMDLNHDAQNELIICGEWMPLRCFTFQKGMCTEITDSCFEKKLNGLWNRLHPADLDHDGDMDLIAGNWGTNSQMQASEKEPVTLHYGDFDNNGFIDPLVSYYIQGASYPMASRDELTDQIVSLRQRFPTYDAYANATITDILTPGQLATAGLLSLNYLQTTWFENVNGKLTARSLPAQANFSPVYAIATDDFNKDGHADLFLAGNIEEVRIKIGKMDANYGVLLCGDGKGNFRYMDQTASGLKIKGCVRDIIQLKNKNGNRQLLLGINNQPVISLGY